MGLYSFTITAGTGSGFSGYDTGTIGTFGSISGEPVPSATLDFFFTGASKALQFTGASVAADLAGHDVYVNGINYGQGDGWDDLGGAVGLQWSSGGPTFVNGGVYDVIISDEPVIHLVGSGGFRTTAGAGATWTLPGTPLEGDLVYISFACDEAIDPDTLFVTTGYTGIVSSAVATPGRRIAYKVMGASPDTQVQVNGVGSSILVAAIEVWRGVDPVDPLDDNSRTTDTGSSGMPDAPSYTTVTPYAMRWLSGTLDDDDAAASVTAPSGWYNLLAHDTGQASTTVGATVMLASRWAFSAGALDPAAFGGTGSDAWQVAHGAFRPLASSGEIEGDLSSSSSTTTTLVGKSEHEAVAAATAAATASFVSEALKEGAFSSTSSSAPSLVSAALKEASIAITSSTVSSFIGASLHEGVMASTGAATGSFVGEFEQDGSGAFSVSAAADPQFASAALAEAALSATSASVVSFESAARAEATVVWAGAETSTFLASAVFEAVLAASSISTSAFLSEALKEASFSSTSATSPTLLSEAIKEAVLSITAQAVVDFIGDAEGYILHSESVTVVNFEGAALAEAELSVQGSSSANFIMAGLLVGEATALGISVVSFLSAYKLATYLRVRQDLRELEDVLGLQPQLPGTDVFIRPEPVGTELRVRQNLEEEEEGQIGLGSDTAPDVFIREKSYEYTPP